MHISRTVIIVLLMLALPLQALAAVGTFACEDHGTPITMEQSLDSLHQHHAGMDHKGDTQNNSADAGCECVSCSPASHTQLQMNQASVPDHIPLLFHKSLCAGRSPDGLFRPPI